MSDRSWPSREECIQLLHSVSDLDLNGWAIDEISFHLQPGVRAVGPRYTCALADGRQLKIWETRFAWGDPDGPAPDVHMCLEVMLRESDGEETAFRANLTKIRNPDLRTLPLLERFVEERLGSDPATWQAAYKSLSDNADADFTARFAKISNSHEFPFMPRKGEDDYDRKYQAWSEGLDRKNRLIEEAYREAHKPLEIVGQHEHFVWTTAIRLAAPDECLHSLLDAVASEALRNQIWHEIRDRVRRAYALGRFIREGEILEDIPLVERKKLSKKQSESGALGGKVSAPKKNAHKEKIWEQMVEYYQPLLSVWCGNEAKSISDVATFMRRGFEGDRHETTWPDKGFPGMGAPNSPQAVPWSHPQLVRRVIPSLVMLGLRWPGCGRDDDK